MAGVENLLEQMRFKTPWPGDPRVNIQNAKGKAKPYQVRQILRAIEQLEHFGKAKS